MDFLNHEAFLQNEEVLMRLVYQSYGSRLTESEAIGRAAGWLRIRRCGVQEEVEENGGKL